MASAFSIRTRAASRDPRRTCPRKADRGAGGNEREELERSYEYLRRAHRNRVREVKRLRREREASRQPIRVRAKW